MPYLGELSALLTAVMWSGSSMAFTAAAVRIGSVQLNINRMILAAVFLFATILIFNLDYHLTQYQIIYLSLSGLVGLLFGDSFLFKAFQLIGARLSMLLMALAPAMTAVLAYFFLGETIKLLGIIGMIITLGGIALVVLDRKDSSHKHSPLGIFYGILGAAGQAAGLILAKIAFESGEVNKMVATFYRIGASIIIMLPFLLLIRKYKNPVKLYKGNSKAFTATLLGTVFGPYLGITFSLIAIANTKVGIAATLMSTMPILMLPLVKYFYKEKLSWKAITGAFIAVAGIAILFLR